MLGLELFNTLCSVNPVQGQNSYRIFDFWHENYYVELVNHPAVKLHFRDFRVLTFWSFVLAY